MSDEVGRVSPEQCCLCRRSTRRGRLRSPPKLQSKSGQLCWDRPDLGREPQHNGVPLATIGWTRQKCRQHARVAPADDSGNHDDGTEKDESAARAQRRTRLLRSSRARADRDTRIHRAPVTVGSVLQLRVGLHGPRRSGDGRNRRPDERAEGGLTRALSNVQLMSGKSFGAPAPATATRHLRDRDMQPV